MKRELVVEDDSGFASAAGFVAILSIALQSWKYTLPVSDRERGSAPRWVRYTMPRRSVTVWSEVIRLQELMRPSA
jgi:hypothetical protein